MSETKTAPAESTLATEQAPLRDPFLAAALAWLIPGLGHWYQGRRAKAVIFFICVTSSFYYGLYLGSGRVVYAAWNQSDRRLPFLCQAFVGAPSLPAIFQARRFDYNVDNFDLRRRSALAAKARLGVDIYDAQVTGDVAVKIVQKLARNEGSFWSWFMVPPVVKAA